LHLLLRLNKVILANRFKHATDHDHVGDEIEAVDVLVGQIPTPPIVKIDLLSPSQVLSRLPRLCHAGCTARSPTRQEVLICGKMSVGMTAMAETPRNRIRAAAQ
jgi:hypothetical protein